MRPRSWTVLLCALIVAMPVTARAQATGRQPRWGTVLLAGEGAPLVLNVAENTASLVRFEDLKELWVELPPELRERLEVVPFGERGMVLSPVRNLAEGERLRVPVTGRTEEGRVVSLTLVLVTRGDEVDAEVRVFREWPTGWAGDSEEGGVTEAMARSILASHGGEERRPPRLALAVATEQTVLRAEQVRAQLTSVVQVERRLFLTVELSLLLRSEPWKLARVRLEPWCRGARAEASALPLLILSDAPWPGHQRYTLATLLPEGVECMALTLEEDGPRTVYFEMPGLVP
ncbi:MAG TPA: DUF2381 family protein [Myxococcaceae bacterium]|nr:DUF2381 family protein [Myxococcaceae bacterium]